MKYKATLTNKSTFNMFFHWFSIPHFLATNETTHKFHRNTRVWSIFVKRLFFLFAILLFGVLIGAVLFVIFLVSSILVFLPITSPTTTTSILKKNIVINCFLKQSVTFSNFIRVIQFKTCIIIETSLTVNKQKTNSSKLSHHILLVTIFNDHVTIYLVLIRTGLT